MSRSNGKAGFQPRRNQLSSLRPSRAPRSPAGAGLRGARDGGQLEASLTAGLKPRPSPFVVRNSGQLPQVLRGGKVNNRITGERLLIGHFPVGYVLMRRIALDGEVERLLSLRL